MYRRRTYKGDKHMTIFVSSFLGSFIGTAIVTFFTSQFFYRLGRKHEREINNER